MLPSVRRYSPFESGPFRLALGTKPLALAEWIELDQAYHDELALKRRLLAEEHARVFVSQPASNAASRELLSTLAAHVARYFPRFFECDRGRIINRLTDESWSLEGDTLDPLEIASRLVQEDLCLLQVRDDDDMYALTAGCVCFPSRWCVRDKLGQSLRAIHTPVAFYDEQIGEPVEKFFRRLAVEKPVWRTNWNIHETAALFQPTGMGPRPRDATITVENAGSRLFLRVERQTLRRLPLTGAVVFTIRTYVEPLKSACEGPEAATRLASALREMPEPTRAYKSQGVFLDAALAWLDARCGDQGQGPRL